MKKKEVAIENCPLCGSKDLDFLIEARDWRGSDERFKIVECGGCSFKITNPRPADEDLGAYYPSDSYVSLRIGQKSCSTAFILKFKSEIKEIN